MADPTPIDRLYSEVSSVIHILKEQAEISLEISADENLRKALLLAAASHFENRICGMVLDFVREKAGGSVIVEQFVRNKAIARQYHTWFEWKDNNANKFFGLFGSEFLRFMKELVQQSDGLRDSIKAFMEIGNTRNRLIHQDYATFPLDKTMEEIFQLYQKALLFVESMPVMLREFNGDLKE
jgi:hypothetical protein